MKGTNAVGWLGLLLALALGCGGDSAGTGGDSNQIACGKVCDKAAACGQASTAAACKQACVARAGTSICKNHQAIVAALDVCLARDCAGYTECVKTLPACEGAAPPDAGPPAGTGGATGGSGGAGSGGTGGVPTGAGGSVGTGGGGGSGGMACTGTGGMGGTGVGAQPGCEACAKFDACCMASLPPGLPPTTCAMGAICNSATVATRDQYAGICRMALADFANDPDAPAACK